MWQYFEKFVANGMNRECMFPHKLFEDFRCTEVQGFIFKIHILDSDLSAFQKSNTNNHITYALPQV